MLNVLYFPPVFFSNWRVIYFHCILYFQFTQRHFNDGCYSSSDKIPGITGMNSVNEISKKKKKKDNPILV